MYRYALLTFLVLAACSSSTAPLHDLSYVTTVTPSSFQIGQTVTVSVTVTNRSNEAQRMNVNMCPGAFVVTTDNGTVVAPGERVCTLQATMKTLQPNESFTFTQAWAGDALPSATGGANVLTPGVYHIRPRALQFGAISSGDPAETAITITP